MKKTKKEAVVVREFETTIQPKNGWFDLQLKEMWKYRDLIFLFVKRNFVSQYKQTVLGPAWALIQPLLTTFVFTFVFGGIAGLAPGGVNSFLYYLCGTILWTYFGTSLTMISSTFITNSNILGKVYFPRMVMPVSTVITNLISLGIQFVFFLLVWLFFLLTGEGMAPNLHLLWLPLLVIQTSFLALGFGIIISSLTTKYRDLSMLVTFGVQLWMYATPVAYPASMFAGSRFYDLFWCNPMAPIVETFRYALLGPGAAQLRLPYLLLSNVVTLVVLFFGAVLFNRVEKNFMDTV